MGSDGRRARTGGKWEGLFLRQAPEGLWELLCQTRGRLHEGETIFFPQGWLHQVVALEPSISLHHNFVSGNNCLAFVSAFLQHRLGGRNI